MKANRRSFFAALFAAPLAAIAALKAPAIPKTKPLGDLIVTIGCDASEFTAAMDRLCAEMEKVGRSANRVEELRAQMEGMPPIIITCDGREIDRFQVLL